MSAIFLMILILKLFGNTLSLDNNNNNDERINEGASTSTQLEECEIVSYVDDVVRLMLAEDVTGGNLTELMNSRFHELQAFYDRISINYILAEHGVQRVNYTTLEYTRREFFTHALKEFITDTVATACSEHYYYKLWYVYDNENNVILPRENISSRSNPENCLCENYEERLILSQPFRLPPLRRPETILQIAVNNNGAYAMQVSSYHVIPVALISRFFEVWLSETLEDIPEVDVNGCLFVLIG